MHRRRFLQAALALAATGVSGGCRRPSPLRVGATVWIGYEPLFAAERLGLLDPTIVHMVELPSSSEVIRALRNGSLDVAALTLDEVLLVRALGADVTVVLVTDTSAGGDVVLARPPIDGLAGLAGRRVAVESGAVGAYMLARCLETAGLAADDVTPVALVNNDHLAAYQAGEVDAVVTYEPMRSMLLGAGAVPVFSSREMPGEIVDVLAIPTDRLGTHGAELTHLCDAWFQTLDRLREHPTETAALVGERTKQPAAEVLASFELVNIPDRAGNLRLLGGDPPALRATGERLQRVLAERGLLERSASLEGLFDARFVDRGQAR